MPRIRSTSYVLRPPLQEPAAGPISRALSTTPTSGSSEETVAVRAVLEVQERSQKRRFVTARRQIPVLHLEIPSDYIQPDTDLQDSAWATDVGESYKGGIVGVTGPQDFWVTFNKDLHRRKMLIKKMT